MILRLIVDTSIARSAGETSHPTSTSCREWLDVIQELEHRVVLTKAIFEEWNRHESKFARTWRLSMIARKRMIFLRDVENVDLREQVDRHAVTDKARAEMLHDVHLLEAALATDKIISSLNDKDRDRFKVICEHIAEIRSILWVNPDKSDEKCIDWLKNGAPPDENRKLGYQPEN